MINVFLLAAAITTFNWTEHIPSDGLKYEKTDGGIKFTLAGRGAMKGGDGYLWADVPLYRRGVLDFDVKLVPQPKNRAQSLFVTLYGIRTFFHDGCKDWRVIFPEPMANRETGFPEEPVRHVQITKLSLDEWHHCRIAFDVMDDRAEFFFDDMSDPAYIAGGVSIWSESEFLGGILRVGGMGGAPNSNPEIKNISLEETTEDEKVEARTETLVFEGITHEFYRVADILVADRPRTYTLDFTRYCYWPKNCYKYSKLPGRETVSRARRIVLVDAPKSFDDVLPDFLIRDMVKSVESGAELIVIDGFYTLDKGEFAGTALESILPEGSLHGTCFPPLPDGNAEILERKVGAGTVKVFRGFKLTGSPDEDFARFKRDWATKLFK